MAALCLPCTAAVASSAASDSHRINTVYKYRLETEYGKIREIESRGPRAVASRAQRGRY